MQIAVVALLVLSVSVFETGAQTAEPCGQGPFGCILVLWPVCGTNGVTYDNPCFLDLAMQCNPSLEIDHNGCCDNEEGRELCRSLNWHPQ